MIARNVAFLALAVCAATASADGKVFSRVARAPVPMADQRALIHWADGVETLVIESSFAGPGTDFAWVVPLPAAPEIAAADRAVLNTLGVVFRPVIIHDISPGWAVLPLVLLGLGAVLLHSSSRVHVALVLVVGLVAASLYVPMLSKASPRPTPTRSGVRVLASGDVGDYTVVTLAGAEAGALAGWLRDAGFEVPEAAVPVIARHVERGGVFVAAKLRAELATDHVRALRPLQFRFPTATPIYPMALTGAAATTPLDLELYVFGPERAEVAGLSTMRCSHVVPPTDRATHSGTWEPSDSLVIRQPDVRALIGTAGVATRLRATLQPAAMQNDLEVTWVPFAATGESAYTRPAAVALAFDAWVWIACAMAFAIMAMRRARPGMPVRGHVVAIVAGCAAAGLVTYAALPTLDGALVLTHPTRSVNGLPRLALAIHDLDGYDASTRFDRAWFDQALSRLRAEPSTDPDVLVNQIAGGPVVLESSPGNLTFTRRTDGDVEVWAYDATGAPIEQTVLPPKPERLR